MFVINFNSFPVIMSVFELLDWYMEFVKNCFQEENIILGEIIIQLFRDIDLFYILPNILAVCYIICYTSTFLLFI